MIAYSLISKMIEDEWNLNAVELGVITGIIFIGCAIGTMISIHYGDSKGRAFIIKTGLWV